MSIRRMLLVGVLILAPLTVRADVDSEHEALARIANELDQLRAMAAASSMQADTSTRIQFRYDWLARDLELVKRGVEDHFDTPRQPRSVEPLKGDYRR